MGRMTGGLAKELTPLPVQKALVSFPGGRGVSFGPVAPQGYAPFCPFSDGRLYSSYLLSPPLQAGSNQGNRIHISADVTQGIG